MFQVGALEVSKPLGHQMLKCGSMGCVGTMGLGGEAPVALLRGSWLCQLAAEGGRLPRRQDLPKNAIWDRGGGGFMAFHGRLAWLRAQKGILRGCG